MQDSLEFEPEVARVWFAFTSFDPATLPRLKAISCGVWYDSTALLLVAYGPCADFDTKDDRWPRPGTGTAVSWTETRTGALNEIYWFAGYTYTGSPTDTTSFCITPHPRQGGAFVDDAVPPNLDQVAAYGRLGFGHSGTIICYEQLGERGSLPEPQIPELGIPAREEVGDLEPGHLGFGTAEIILSWDQLRSDATWESFWTLRPGVGCDTLCFQGYRVATYRKARYRDPMAAKTEFERQQARLLEAAGDSVRSLTDLQAQMDGFSRALRRLDPDARYIESCTPRATDLRLSLHTERSPVTSTLRQRASDGLLELPDMGPRIEPAAPRDMPFEMASVRKSLVDGCWIVYTPSGTVLRVPAIHVGWFRQLVALVSGGTTIGETDACPTFCGPGMDLFWQALGRESQRGGRR